MAAGIGEPGDNHRYQLIDDRFGSADDMTVTLDELIDLVRNVFGDDSEIEELRLVGLYVDGEQVAEFIWE